MDPTEFELADDNKALLLTLRKMANEIFSTLGKGYSEVIYHKAFTVELQKANIRYDIEVPLIVSYKGHTVGQVRADIVVRGKIPIIIELKAIGTLRNDERWQLTRYLKLLNVCQGVLINFSHISEPQIEYILYTDSEFYQYNIDNGKGVLMT